MDLYATKSAGKTPQLVWLVAQLVLLGISYWILFPGGDDLKGYSGFMEKASRVTICIFNLTTFIRLIFTLFVFIKRSIPAEEAVSVIVAFALYFVGFSILTVNGTIMAPIGLTIGIALFVVGCYFNTYSEFQRLRWKRDRTNFRRVFTGGLFGLSRHPNYFGDCLWVLGYAVVTGNSWAYAIPVALFAFFLFYNIPLQERHMTEKYGGEYMEYSRRVKKLVPFIV